MLASSALVLFLCALGARGAVTGQDSVIAFAADTLAAALTSMNRFVLQSLYSAERAGVDATDTHAVYSALATSRRLREPAWQQRVEQEFARRASFVTDGGLQCDQLDDANATAFAAAGFLGASVFLESTAFIDVNCDTRFTNGTDLPLSLFANFVNTTSTLNTTTGVRTNTTLLAIPLEIVQSTFDARLKRLLTLVPLKGVNASGTILFFQPGLAAAFLPMLAGFQPSFTNEVFGEAVYPSQGNSEATISSIVAFEELCTSGATITRFNKVPIDLRYAFGTNTSDVNTAVKTLNISNVVAFGQCSTAAVSAVLKNDQRANLVAGIFFVDSNRDSIRNPREQTTSFFEVVPVALVNGSNAHFLTVQQNADGTLLGAIQNSSSAGGGGGSIDINALSGAARFRQLDTLPLGANVATIAAEITSIRGTNQVKDQFGRIRVPEVCGTANSLFGVSVRIDELTSASVNSDTISGGMFLNQALRNTNSTGNDALLLGESTTPLFRQPNNNIGFVCDRVTNQAPITVVAQCDNTSVRADQLEIIDQYMVTIPNNVPAFQTWLATTTTRPFANTPVDNTTTYDVLPVTFGTNVNAVYAGATINITNTGPTMRFDVTVADIANRDVSTASSATFFIVVITAYARPASGLNCSGFPGEEIVSELVLSDIDLLAPQGRIGQFGALCRHTQAPECVNGGGSTPNNTGPLPPGPDGTLPIVLIFTGIAIVLVIVMVAVAAQ